MDYSPWSSKNLIDRNRLKKFMQIGVDVTYMHTNFGGCDLFGFGDIGTFKNDQILKGSHISKTEEATPTKIGVHALDINPYLHEFFEPIPID